MADVATALKDWSSTDSSNAPSGAATIGTGLDDNLRTIQGAITRGLSHKGADIASATTTDLGAIEGLMHDITGTTTITGFGTVRAGILKVIKFEGALTLTHNATSLILPGAANITTADGDVAHMFSEGSGNWRCLSYVKTIGAAVGGAQYKVVNGTFDTASATSTNITVTGVGFKPKLVEMLMVFSVGSSNGSIGWSDGTTEGSITNYDAIASGDWAHVSLLGQNTQGSGVFQTFSIASGGSLDADGCTIKNTKTGTPAGTINYTLKFSR